MVKIKSKPLNKFKKTKPVKAKNEKQGKNVKISRNNKFKKQVKEAPIAKVASKKKVQIAHEELDSDNDKASDISFDMSDAENITDSEEEKMSDADATADLSDNDSVLVDEDADLSEQDADLGDKDADLSDEDADLDDENGDLSNEDNFEDHKKALERLKDTDPEFFKYLQDNDKKLLNFNLSDDEDKDDDDEEDDEDAVHKPIGELEVASDESDFEPDDDDHKVDSRVITLKLLKQWQSDIQTDNSNRTITCVARAFNAALRRVTVAENEEPAHYKVEGSSVFNAIIQLCVLELGPAIRRFLGMKTSSKQAPHKCKKFVKVKTLLKGYFADLLKLLSGVTSSNILNVLLKHLHYMSPLVVSFPNIAKGLLKKLVNLWGTGDESVRVVAFLCLLRITHNQQQVFLDSVLRMMYMTYVKNSKFVSVNSLPGINFMRRSLVELYALDLNVSYQHVFLYIRQLAINLRNAVTDNKKEHIQAVCNWQFVNSLRLWGNLLAVTCNKPQLQPLVYPFVQVCLGTIKLVPTTQYYPLRFHVVQVLMDLSRDTGVFIPVLPFILEVLSTYDFNKKHSKVSMKPLQFICVLRLSKSQLSENGFKDATIDIIYAQLLEYMASQSHSIAFPDLALFCKLQMKAFIKKCNIAKYQKNIGQLLDKIEQSVQFIENERKKVTFSLTEFKKIDAWETTIKNKGTPLSTFYENWNKFRNIKKSKVATNNEEIGDYNLPTIKRNKRDFRNDKEKEVVLFPSDSEDDNDDLGFGEKKEKKKQRGKRAGKNVKKPVVEMDHDMNIGAADDDIIEDLKASDW